MDAVTYPNKKVSEYVTENFVPLRIGHDEQPYADQFLVKWTPKLYVLDYKGAAHHDALGFFPPDELVAFLHLGRAKMAFNNDLFEDAVKLFEKLLLESPASGSAPEAVFLHGVSNFKKNHEAAPLKEVYRRLKLEYSQTSWAQRGFPYWNL